MKNKAIVWQFLHLFGQNEIVPFFDEIQGYSMAIFTLFDRNEIAPSFDEIKAIVWPSIFDRDESFPT